MIFNFSDMSSDSVVSVRSANAVVTVSTRKRTKSDSSDDEGHDRIPTQDLRRQNIDSDNRRRDKLEEGYVALKAELPETSQKSSKLDLLHQGKQSRHPPRQD
jgi:hypothetical protein